jgi:hypothetical protein
MVTIVPPAIGPAAGETASMRGWARAEVQTRARRREAGFALIGEI